MQRPEIGEMVGSPWGGRARFVARVRVGAEPRQRSAGVEVDLLLHWFAHGRSSAIVAVEAETGLPFARVSINVEEVALAAGEFVAHHDLVADGTIAALLRLAPEVVADTGRRVSYGRVSDAPVLRIADETMGKVMAYIGRND